MSSLHKLINKKLNRIIWNLASTGIVLLLAATFVAWVEVASRLVVSIVILVVAYNFMHLAYYLWEVKKELNELIKF